MPTHPLLVATAALALAAGPQAQAAPVSEWLGATAGGVVYGAAVVYSPFSFVERLTPSQALQPGQSVLLNLAKDIQETAANGSKAVGQVDWNTSTSLDLGPANVGFDTLTFSALMNFAQQWVAQDPNGNLGPAQYTMQGGVSDVLASFRLGAPTDARIVGSVAALGVPVLNFPVGDLIVSMAAELQIWSDDLGSWQALIDPVPEIQAGESFEWEARLEPGLYQWSPHFAGTQTAFDPTEGVYSFDAWFDLSMTLSEVAAPPPGTPVTEPGSLPLVASSALAALALRGMRRRGHTPR